MADTPTVLILGGTAEARALADALADKGGLRVVSSLAGRTENPRLPAGEIRIGGFGGAEGLADWLAVEKPVCLVDATHPFAARISANAATACEREHVPRLVLDRPPWTPEAEDRWTLVADAAEAARYLPDLGHRAFLTVGSNDLADFAPAAERGATFVVRAVSAPDAPPFPAEFIAARGPFSVDEEEALLRDRHIDVVVTKDSGGTTVAAKLVAARRLGLPVLMLRRPRRAPGEAVERVEDAVRWVLLQAHRATLWTAPP